MSKSLSKGEKLDLLIEELSKIKGGMKTLLKQHTALAAELKRLSKDRGKAPKTGASRKSGAPKAAKPAATPASKRKSPVVLQVAPPPAAKAAG